MFVTVACKLPTGLVIDRRDPRSGVTVASVKLNGSRLPVDANGMILNKFELSNAQGGPARTFGLTQVEASFWEAWLAENADYPPVRAGLVFAHEQRATVEAMSRELATQPTGLDAMDPSKPGKDLEPIPGRDYSAKAA